MAPRAYWKGYLRLSLVSCPIQLFPATSESEKISFNQINKETGNRVRYRKVDEATGEEVRPENIAKAYQISKEQYVEFTDEELEAVAIDSTRAIDIDSCRRKRLMIFTMFVPTTLLPRGMWARKPSSLSEMRSNR